MHDLAGVIEKRGTSTVLYMHVQSCVQNYTDLRYFQDDTQQSLNTM